MVKPTGCANEIGFVWPDVNGHKTCNTYERSNTQTQTKNTQRFTFTRTRPSSSPPLSVPLSPYHHLCSVCRLFVCFIRLDACSSGSRLLASRLGNSCVCGFVFVLCTQYNMYIQRRIIHVSCRLYNISILVLILCWTFLPNIFLVAFFIMNKLICID